MKFNKLVVITVGAGMLLSFTCGVVTVKYKIFPFGQLKAINQIVSPSPSPSPGPNLRYTDYFYHKKSFFEQHGGHNYDVVFIGDSITDHAEWEDLFPALKIANRGIGGDRTDGVLKRLESIYSTSADRAFIMIGINDLNLGVNVDEVFDNYMRIIRQISEHGMKVYIQSTILAGKRYEILNTRIAELNTKLELFATQNEFVEYIDLNACLAQDSLLNPKYSRDGIHLNATGYAVWKDIISPYIQ